MTTIAPPDAAPRDYLTDALDAIPGRRGVVEALADVEQRLSALAAIDSDPPQRDARAAETLIAGASLDFDQFADDLAADVRAAERRQLERNALGQVRDRLTAHLELVDRVRADDALGYLDDRLGELLEQARPLLAELGNVRTADEAIDADTGPAWRRTVALAASVADIRGAQVEVIRHRYRDSAHGDAGAIAAVALFGSLAHPERVADPDDLLAQDRRQRRDGARPSVPWAGAGVPALRALLTEGAGPRVATIAQLRSTRSRVLDLATGTPPAGPDVNIVNEITTPAT